MKEKINNAIIFIKNNWYFSLLLIPYSFILGKAKVADNDLWFLLNTGRNILNNGINYVDTFTIHSGLQIIVQQWLSAVLFWVVFNKLGKYGMMFLVFFLVCILSFVFYKLCKFVSKSKFIGFLALMFMLITVMYNFTSRPQMFSYIFICLELLILEKYIQSNNKKILIWLPIISLVMINMHASMWTLLFAIMLTFILNKINVLNIRKDNYDIKPLIIISIIMFLVGFINPYTYKSMFYFVYSTSPMINKVVSEMAPYSFSLNIRDVLIIFFVVGLFASSTFIKDFKLDIRHFCLVCGTGLMMLLHFKCIPYFVICIIYSLAYGFKNVDFRCIKIKKTFSKIRRLLFNIVKYSSLIISIFIFINSIIISIKNINYKNDYSEMIDFLLENYDKQGIILYTSYNNGGYTEYRGIKSFIDPRAELFIKKHNGKRNIFNEIYEISTYSDIEGFINKYKFTHLMVYRDGKLYNYLVSLDNYKMIYEDKELEEVLFVNNNFYLSNY